MMQEFDQNPAPSQTHSMEGPGFGPSAHLRKIIQTGKIPNALLFYGTRGTGKKEAAMKFAKSCNCTADHDRPCNVCTSCTKINANMHPDMIFLGPENNKKNISITQIRDMGRLICARSNEAVYRMVCILDAHLMNVQAQNGLLKVLEEPPKKTFFILLATGTSPLLPTILSRCRKFMFCPQSPKQVRQILCTRYCMDKTRARIISLTLGPYFSLTLDAEKREGQMEDPVEDWINFRQWVIGSILDVIAGPNQKQITKGLDLSQKLSSNANELLHARAIVRTILRDFCVLRYSPEQIVNLDFFDKFKDISQTIVYPTFLGWLTAFCETEKRLDSNSGQRLTLDRFFLELSLEKRTHPI